MIIRNGGICVLGLFVFALGSGCKKSDSSDSTAGRAKQSDIPAATIYWVGMSRLATDTNAAGFLNIWRLPETQRLKAQTLDKLALLPWGLTQTNSKVTITNYSAFVRANPPASLLRPVLEDLVQVESYLEVRDATAQSGQMALAIHLRPERAGVWETNLGAVFEFLTGVRRTPVQSGAASRGWEIQATNSSVAFPAMARHAQFIHSGQWTILGLAPGQNAVFGRLLDRVQHNRDPFPASEKSDWLETTLDLKRLSTILSLGLDLPQDWPGVSLAINGNGKNVVTRGHLNFSKPLPFEI